MSAATAFLTTPVRASAVAKRATTKRAVAALAAAKETTPVVKAEDFKCPLTCEEKSNDATTHEMAKAKCVHPERPVSKACQDCPRR
ncbi:uncharacterized protein MICPUCDRAFT_58768 [Micromonas pusilla CCMP1545]|uniref:Predicted protein n=1 Tax=Micromonas pusilla (strain CCMP1545) TaxID=564608 RepID=C1MUD9_MICPC|nr:uncharacterized protein MICPUCDRAFT_58768 [Micromonas pusilla CCMP1545]EEH56309.1 predicted protein [Micromonas pusilla CCMP1545]|eukprot:XP_003059177.1 predicted protein [Micromonas pusilla CCMP1545]